MQGRRNRPLPAADRPPACGAIISQQRRGQTLMSSRLPKCGLTDLGGDALAAAEAEVCADALAAKEILWKLASR